MSNDELTALQQIIADQQARLAQLEAMLERQAVQPSLTLDDIRAAIETGLLADRLADHWANVFQPPDGPCPESPEQASAWHVKMRRVGQLHPDAAHEISLRLRDIQIYVTPKQVQDAKRKT